MKIINDQLQPSKVATERITDSMDKKTFFGSLLFIFAALVNPRDFPIPNVPLIYPVFVAYLFMLGPTSFLKGLKKTRFLWILIVFYWLYMNVVKVFLKGENLLNVAYLFEPVMIVIGAGMATVRRGGLKAFLSAFLIIIIFSTVCGLWIFFIGEPITSFRTLLQQNLSGNPFQTYSENVEYIGSTKNAGLSLRVFHFSYQLAVATTIGIISIFLSNPGINKRYVSLWIIVVILFLGILTNTERASIISISAGFVSFIWLRRRDIFTSKWPILFASCLLVISLYILSSVNLGKESTLIERLNEPRESNSFYTRLIRMPSAAAATIFSEPLGTGGGFSEHYVNVAYNEGWFLRTGQVVASHNHYTNIIMYSGAVGFVLIVLLFTYFKRKIGLIMEDETKDKSTVLVAAAITAVVHALSHNAGFFSLEPVTEILFGLIWCITPSKFPLVRRFPRIRL